MNPVQTNQPDIFTRLGMASASDEQKQQLAEQLADLTMTRVLSKVADQISEEQMAELERLIDAGGDQVDDRLRQLVPGYDELVASTAREVGDKLVADQQADPVERRTQTDRTLDHRCRIRSAIDQVAQQDQGGKGLATLRVVSFDLFEKLLEKIVAPVNVANGIDALARRNAR